MSEYRDKIVALITDAIYDARNAGLTIGHAAEDAADRIIELNVKTLEPHRETS